ncbi:hypothetical protein [Dehalococcoides mccartyi]|uniref:hypothetical protein n=1 Tax=Dehalococcoides TaxID=61434 RepID=UPI003242986B
MDNGIVIDGHFMRDAKRDLTNESGELYKILFWIESNCKFAMSTDLETAWESKIGCKADSLDIIWCWYENLLINNKINFVSPVKTSNKCKNHIRKNLGLTSPGDIYKYFDCANATIAPRYILSEDIDMHEPRARSYSSKNIKQLMDDRSGVLCRYVYEEINIRIGTRQDLIVHFNISRGDCDNGCNNQCPRKS